MKITFPFRNSHYDVDYIYQYPDVIYIFTYFFNTGFEMELRTSEGKKKEAVSQRRRTSSKLELSSTYVKVIERAIIVVYIYFIVTR